MAYRKSYGIYIHTYLAAVRSSLVILNFKMHRNKNKWFRFWQLSIKFKAQVFKNEFLQVEHTKLDFKIFKIFWSFGFWQLSKNILTVYIDKSRKSLDFTFLRLEIFPCELDLDVLSSIWNVSASNLYLLIVINLETVITLADKCNIVIQANSTKYNGLQRYVV